MEAKETIYKTILKSNIVQFLSYSILIGFIFLLISIAIRSALANMSSTLLSVLLSLIAGILIFNILHFICKSSTLESLKKMSMDEENENHFIKKMNLFFILCIIFSALFCMGYLWLDNFIYANAINQAYVQYDFISHEFAERIVNHIRQIYRDAFLSKVFSTIIIELSLVASFFSLIPYQKKLLKKYNKA